MDELIKSEFERVKDKCDMHNDRICKLESNITQIQSIAMSVERMATNMEHMVDVIKEQGLRLGKLESEPSDKWNNLTKTIIASMVGAVIAFVIGRVL